MNSPPGNPYESPNVSPDEPVTGLTPDEAIARHKEKFARELVRINRVLFVIGLAIGIVVALLMLGFLPLLRVLGATHP